MKPREKYESRGLESLSDRELAAIVISSGSRGVHYRDIANNLVTELRKGSPDRPVDLETLSQVRGLGRVKSMQVLAGIELGRRLYQLYSSEKPRISSTKESVAQFEDIKYKKREYLKAIYLNARFELLHKEVIGVGNIDSLFIQPRDILLPALEKNALYIVMAHNHPSGVLDPSRQDIELTDRVGRVAKELGFVLLDHLIVAKNGWRRIVQKGSDLV
ncbi:MAG: DNA repair protein RadC [Candidatus Dojkabacteria bacterium]|nr:MAG: DNA repair protein RadC [Candidatus Dojkabacteria bacterium]